MKKLLIYFSLNNNGDKVADFFKEKDYDIRKVISKCKYPKSKFSLMMIGGYKSTFNKKDKLLNFDTDITNYDKIVIGSPIWNDRLSAPINKVISLLDFKDKDLSFVLYSASGNAGKAKEKIRNLYGIDAIVLKEPKKNIEELTKIKDM